MTDEKEIFEAAVMGEECELWLKSTIGQHVLRQRAEAEKKVMEAFRRADPGDTKAIAALQRALDAANTGVQWLVDAVHIGRQYEQILSAEKESSYE